MKKLTPAQRRVAIAKDVLKQIKLNTVSMKTGTFLRAPSINRFSFYDKNVNQANVLSGELKNCNVCAIGAAMLSSIRLFNKFDALARNIGVEEAFGVVRKYFSKSQANKIECAFEMGKGAVSADDKNMEAIRFGKDFSNPTDRAKAIFQNIVKNGGTFNP